ncbi:MAG: nickel-dependent hydrogenase large subunit [Rhodoferax sp.]|nr:nickel-dependent hydrogenase large subunit [Rhodoferax sp.]
MAQRITIDPITRIEGHLRIDVDIDGGKVNKAWSSGQMWRGVELILLGRDPRDAWAITQRICGVCTTVHAMASVRAVENALNLEIPLNAQYIRNIIMTAHAVHDAIVHFYHLSALDWVDVTSALKADPDKTSVLGESLSSWHLNSKHEMRRVHERLKHFVNGGQLGIFTNGYWGHPAMKLTPEVNLLAVAHYLQALEVQRKANPLATDSQAVLTVERLMAIKGWIDELADFVKNVYLIDVAAVGAFYAEWTTIGKGVTNYLSVPDVPLDGKGTQFAYPGGFIEGGDLASYKPITSFHDEYFRKGVEESVKHSWYNYSDGGALHPFKGETTPNYTDFKADAKYSWLKSPTFYGKVAQVGPLARVLTGLAAKHEATTKYATAALDTVSALAKTKVGLDAMHSTIGRHAARAVTCCVNVDLLSEQWTALLTNMGKGDLTTFNKPVFPKDEVAGVGFHEAPRGALSHWIVIENGKIKNYQCVVPSTWNACPRNDKDEPGPYEASLVNTPIADNAKPLEVLRTIHSFDPCIACAIHLTDTENDATYTVKAV